MFTPAQLRQLSDLVEEQVKNLPEYKNIGWHTDDGSPLGSGGKSLGDFLLAIKRGDYARLNSVYKARRADIDWKEGSKDMSGISGPGGGYVVPTEYIPQLQQSAGYAAVVRRRASIIPVSTSQGEVPALDMTAPTAGQGDTGFAGGVTVEWAGEGSAGSEVQPVFDLVGFNIRKMAAYTEVPNELVMDSGQSIEAILTQLFGRAVDSMEDYAFLRGNGVGKPLGVLNAGAAITVTAGATGVFDYDDALSMRSKFLPFAGSRDSTAWVIHPSVIPQIGVFESSAGGGVFQANFQDPLGENLLGFPILVSEHLPQLGNDGAVILADFSAYAIFDRSGIAVAYSEHAGFTTDKATWRVTKRLDGQPWLQEAPTLADPQGSYQVSPFVILNDT